MNEPSWQPDPTGRHHYRWWDGQAWGESVSDDGIAAVDPLPVPAALVTVSTSPPIGAPAPAAPLSSVYATEPIKPRRLLGPLIAITVLVLGALGAVIYLVFMRSEEEAIPASAGITSGHVSGPDAYVLRDVTLDDGDAIRYRIEGNPDRDLLTFLVVPEELALSHASRYFRDYGTNVGLTDATDLFDEYTDVDDVVSDPDTMDTFLGYKVLQNSDRCCVGVPDSDTFIATVPGTYKILVVEAQGRDSDVRIIVDKFPRQLFSYADITESLDNSEFFTDSGFFRDTDPFEED